MEVAAHGRRLSPRFACRRDAGRRRGSKGHVYEALQDNYKRNYRELQEAIEYMKTQQNGHLATTERKNRLMMGASQEVQNKSFKEVLIWRRSSRTLTVSCSRPMRSCVSQLWKHGKVTRPRSVWIGGRCQGPKALKVKLDLLERQDGGALWSSGSVWTRELCRGPKFCEQCWEFAGKEEGSGATRVGRHAGVRVVSVERNGRGHGREQGGVDFHSQCGEQFGWMAGTQFCVRQVKPSDKVSSTAASRQKWWKMLASRTRQTSARSVTICLGQHERKEPTINNKRWEIPVAGMRSRG